MKTQVFALFGLILAAPGASALGISVNLDLPDLSQVASDVDQAVAGTVHGALAPLGAAADAPAPIPRASTDASATTAPAPAAPNAPLQSSSTGANANAPAAPAGAGTAGGSPIPAWAWATTVALLGIACVILIGALIVGKDRQKKARRERIANDVASVS